MTAIYEVPDSYSKRDRAACLLGLRHVKDYDIDNIVKTVLDACNGVLWNDKQVTTITAKKHYGTTAALLFRVRGGR